MSYAIATMRLCEYQVGEDRRKTISSFYALLCCIIDTGESNVEMFIKMVQNKMTIYMENYGC